MEKDWRGMNFSAICKIDLKQKWEIQYWTIKWGVTEIELLNAIENAASACVRDVEAYLITNDLIT